MRIVRAIVLALVSAVAAAGAVYFLVVRPRIREWGIEPGDSDLAIPGDDLVPEANAIETRGVAIDAPPSAVWPWLVQMGYGRAGWYSYDQMDMKGASASDIKPELQHIEPGDIMPTHPGGGFVVKVVEPERALVLYSDTEIVRSQQEAAQADGSDTLPTAGLKVSGAMMGASYPEFAASWAFFLAPTEGGTRLIERLRARTPGSGPMSAVLGEVMGTGIVLMTASSCWASRPAPKASSVDQRLRSRRRSLSRSASSPLERATHPATARVGQAGPGLPLTQGVQLPGGSTPTSSWKALYRSAIVSRPSSNRKIQDSTSACSAVITSHGRAWSSV